MRHLARARKRTLRLNADAVVYGSADPLFATEVSFRSLDRHLKVWEVESRRELRTLHGHSEWVNGVALSGEGRLAVSASWDKTLKVWEVQSAALLATFTCDSSPTCCALVNDGKLTVAGDVGGCVHFLRVEEPRPKARPAQ